MIVLDTHVLIWWLSGARKLTARASREVRSAKSGSPALVSAISTFEIATAVRRGRLELGVPLENWFADLSALPEVRIQPVTQEIALLGAQFPDEAPGDPADRLIAATALVHGARLVTADSRLRGLPQLQTVW